MDEPKPTVTAGDATKVVLGTILRRALFAGGTALATHGVIQSGQVETFVGLGIGAGAVAYDLWRNYGRAILTAELEVWKAKALARAAAARNPPGKPPAALILFALVLPAVATLLLAAPAMAQTKLAVRADDRAGPVTSDPGGSNGAVPASDLLGKIQSAKRDDLVYAKALAEASNTEGGRIRAACWGAWIDLIDMQQGAGLKDAQGNPLVRPEPSLFSRFEALAQLSDALQPNAKFQASCAPVAQGLKLRILDFVGKVVGGGFSLGTLVPGL